MVYYDLFKFAYENNSNECSFSDAGKCNKRTLDYNNHWFNNKIKKI